MADEPAQDPPLLLRALALPADLAAALLFVVLTDLAIFLPVISETPLRVVLGLSFVLFIPGYAFIAALFPEAGPALDETTTVESPSPTEDMETTAAQPDEPEENRGISGLERVALSFGLSIAIVPLIGLVLNFTPFGIRLVPIVVSLTAVTVLFILIAAVRRWQLPPADRFQVPYKTWFSAAYAELLEPNSRTDAALNVLLVLSVLLALGSVGYAVAVPQQGEQFTEFYLLTENESGALVASDYPTEFEAGESKQITVGIGNHEHREMNYTVIAQMQRVSIVNNETRVQESSELHRFQATVGHNETWHRQHAVAPEMTGERLRLQYLLYRGTPAKPLNRSAAYRELHLWVNVSAAGETAAG